MQRKDGQYWLRKCENWTNFLPDDPPVICAMINAEKNIFIIITNVLIFITTHFYSFKTIVRVFLFNLTN